jgi:hypothetical protein
MSKWKLFIFRAESRRFLGARTIIFISQILFPKRNIVKITQHVGLSNPEIKNEKGR